MQKYLRIHRSFHLKCSCPQHTCRAHVHQQLADKFVQNLKVAARPCCWACQYYIVQTVSVHHGANKIPTEFELAIVLLQLRTTQFVPPEQIPVSRKGCKCHRVGFKWYRELVSKCIQLLLLRSIIIHSGLQSAKAPHAKSAESEKGMKPRRVKRRVPDGTGMRWSSREMLLLGSPLKQWCQSDSDEESTNHCLIWQARPEELIHVSPD